MKRSVAALVSLILGIALSAIASPAVVAPYCGIRWGSQPHEPAYSAGALSNVTTVRAGRHACFDRLVIDFAGDVTDASVVYLSAKPNDSAGTPIALRGGARLQIWIGLDGQAFQPRNPSEVVGVRGYRTFRQVLWNGPGELDLGIRARLPFRVFALDGPGSGSRLVIDVAHRW